MLPGIFNNLTNHEHDGCGLWWHQGSSQVSAQLVSCATIPKGDIYLGLMMDDDVAAVAEESAQPEEVNYMDELLSE